MHVGKDFLHVNTTGYGFSASEDVCGGVCSRDTAKEK